MQSNFHFHSLTDLSNFPYGETGCVVVSNPVIFPYFQFGLTELFYVNQNGTMAKDACCKEEFISAECVWIKSVP